MTYFNSTNMTQLTVPIPGKGTFSITFPDNIDLDDIEMIRQYLTIFFKRKILLADQDKHELSKSKKSHADLVTTLSGFARSIENCHFDIKPETKETCRWKLDPDADIEIDGPIYLIGCRKKEQIPFSHCFEDADYLHKTEFKFCPYCSKPIEVVEDE